jgi:hypothetical protein
MSGKATLQTLPNQTDAVVHAASPPAEQPEGQNISSEQAAGEDLAAKSDDGLADRAPAERSTLPKHSRFSSLAAALRSDRGTFLQVLDHAVDGAVPAAADDGSEESDDSLDESAAFEKIVAALVADDAATTAVVVGAALAARTVARALLQTEGDFDGAAAEALLAAWLDAARALLRVRGIEGLLRLVPAARNLARRAAEHREVAPAIADAMRRVAARIADAEHSLGPTPRRLSQRQEREQMRVGAFALPRCIVIRGQLQLVFHAH